MNITRYDPCKLSIMTPICLFAGEMVAGHTTEYVNSVLEKRK